MNWGYMLGTRSDPHRPALVKDLSYVKRVARFRGWPAGARRLFHGEDGTMPGLLARITKGNIARRGSAGRFHWAVNPAGVTRCALPHNAISGPITLTGYAFQRLALAAQARAM